MIYGILLAAGSSTRFGADKLLYPLAGSVSMGLMAARNLAAGVDRVVAVVRPGADRLAGLFSSEDYKVVICPGIPQGMGMSLAWGVRSAPDATGWLVALADMPFIHPATIRGVARLIDQGAALAAPVYQERRGHPVGFCREFAGALSELEGDTGAREILRSHAERLTLFACNDPGILQDIDVPSDLSPIASLH